jgi:hypothetical protein
VNDEALELSACDTITLGTNSKACLTVVIFFSSIVSGGTTLTLDDPGNESFSDVVRPDTSSGSNTLFSAKYSALPWLADERAPNNTAHVVFTFID